MAVRQVAARRSRHAHDRVAGLAKSGNTGEVRRASGVRLNVSLLRGEQAFQSGDCDLFDLIDDLLAFVIPLVRVALGVLVGEHRTRGLHDRARGVILARDEANLVVLEAVLLGDEARDVGIGFGNGGSKAAIACLSYQRRRACATPRLC